MSDDVNSDDYDRFEADVRLEVDGNGGEEIVIPRWPDDETPALLRAVADAWEAANKREDWDFHECVHHVWTDGTVAGFRRVCVVCGAMA